VSQSCIYEGTVAHRRRHPVEHAFQYRIFMLLLDLAELPALFRGRLLWSATRPALAWFRRADYLGDPRIPLDIAVRDLVEERLGRRPLGAVRLLTHLRYAGICFNPISFYYCHDGDGGLDAVVLEVSNTPWRDRHDYVVDMRGDALTAGVKQGSFTKKMRVSPFLGMDLVYRWRMGIPDSHLLASIACETPGEGLVFDASLNLRRRPMNRSALRSMLIRYPPMSLKVIGAIYFEALRLRLKQTPVHPYPGGRA
jgi:uncharacterized protein